MAFVALLFSLNLMAVQVFPNQGGTGGTESERGLKEEPAASSPKLHCDMFEALRKLEKAQYDIKQLNKKQLSRGHGDREPRERKETQCKAEKPNRKQPNQELSEKDGKVTQEGGPFLYRPKFYSYPGYPGFPNFG